MFPAASAVILAIALTFAGEAAAGIAPRAELRTAFIKAMNFDGWTGDIDYARDFGGAGLFKLTQSTDLQLHRVPGYYRRWRLDQALNMELQDRPWGGWGWSAAAAASRFSDETARALNRNPPPGPPLPENYDHPALNPFESTAGGDRIDRLYVGGGVAGGSGAYSTTLTVGPVSEWRNGRRLDGLRNAYQFDARLGGNRLKAAGWNESFEKSQDWAIDASLDGLGKLTTGAEDLYSVNYYGSRRREGLGIADLASQRVDRRLNIVNQISSHVGQPLRLAWSSKLANETTSHSGVAGADDLNSIWSNDVVVGWEYRRFDLRLAGGGDIQDQRYHQDLTQGRHTHLGLFGVHTRAAGDSLALGAQFFRYRYDTPRESDYNDRDELRRLFTVSWSRLITGDLRLTAGLEADWHHLVYIYRQRSGDNRWNRLLRLRCGTPWHNEVLFNRPEFSVLANYTQYDFAASDAELSRVYRAFNASDTLLITVKRALRFEISAAAVSDDNGRLQWEDWIEDVSEHGHSVSTSFVPGYAWKGGHAGAGWSWYSRRSWRHQTDGSLLESERITSQGPVAMLHANGPFKGISADLYGRWLTVEDRNRGSYRIPDFNLSIVWTN